MNQKQVDQIVEALAPAVKALQDIANGVGEDVPSSQSSNPILRAIDAFKAFSPIDREELTRIERVSERLFLDSVSRIPPNTILKPDAVALMAQTSIKRAGIFCDAINQFRTGALRAAMARKTEDGGIA